MDIIHDLNYVTSLYSMHSNVKGPKAITIGSKIEKKDDREKLRSNEPATADPSVEISR